MKIFKKLIIFISLLFLSIGSIFAQTNNSIEGINIYPAKLIVSEGLNEYDLTLTNNYNETKSFDIKIDVLNEIDNSLAKKLNIAPYAYFDKNTVSLNAKETKILKLHLNKDIENIKTSLYGKIYIITKNPNNTQTTINHGFGIPIVRNIGTVLGTSTQDLEIKDISFTKDFFTLNNEAKIDFNINNRGEDIQKIYGEYKILNNNDEVIYHKAISDFNYTLMPNQSQNIKDSLKIDDLIGKYKLEISLTDGNGNVLSKGSAEIISFNTLKIAMILGGIILLILLIINLKRIFRLFNKQKVLKLNSIIILILILSSLAFPIHSQVMKSSSYQIPESDFASGNNSTSTTYRVRDEQGNLLGGTASSTSYATTDGTVPLYFNFVPPAATVSNNSGTYYDRLNVIVNQGTTPTDSDYAIVVTSTAFSGVRYVQSDNTLGASLDNNTGWRKYNSGSTNWGGGSGVNVTGLTFGTSYTFYVKSRQRYNTSCVSLTCNIPASESPIVLLPSSEATPNTTVSTASPTLAFQILGESVGGINDTASTSSSVDFGILSPSVSKTASNTLRVTTNASNGYNVYMSANQRLQAGSSYIDWFTGGSATYSAPQNWSSPTASYPNAGWIGYYAHDTDLTQFSGGKYAPFPVSPTNDIVTTSTTQNGSAQDNDVTYKIEINASQPAGNYTGMTITYVLTGSF